MPMSLKSAHRFADYPLKIVGNGKTVRAPPAVYAFGGQSGGKWEGTSFFYRSLLESEEALKNKFGGGVFLACPKTTVIRTGCFEGFMEENGLYHKIEQDKGGIIQSFISAKFSKEARKEFRRILQYHVRPIVVRSSALNEDAERASFAGIYGSVFLPNCHPDGNVRLRQFETALKLVFASTFSPQAGEYRRRLGLLSGSEQMAAVVQNVVGRAWELQDGAKIYHPELSFAFFSFNDYAAGGIRPADGFFRLSFGLGLGVVQSEDRSAVRVNAGKPLPLAGISDDVQMLSCAPQSFFALELSAGEAMPAGENSFAVKMPLSEHGNRGLVERHCGWFSPEEGRITASRRDGRSFPVMNFSNLLSGAGGVPFAGVLKFLNGMLKSKFGMDVDFEGAADIVKCGGEERLVVYPLQARTQVRLTGARVKALPEISSERIVAEGSGGAGRGSYSFSCVLAVKPESLGMQSSRRIAGELAALNRRLESDKRYLLIVPGRFGSSDESLGVAGDFSTISNADGVIELMRGSWQPSNGMHFFEAVVGAGMAYLSCKEEKISWEKLGMLSASRKVENGGSVHQFELKKALELRIDEEGNWLLYSG